MKGPFGLLLIGGGIILIVGLFTGKITFPGSAGATGGATIKINPSGTSVQPILQSGKKTCPAGFVMGSDGNCYVQTG